MEDSTRWEKEYRESIRELPGTIEHVRHAASTGEYEYLEEVRHGENHHGPSEEASDRLGGEAGGERADAQEQQARHQDAHGRQG